MSRPIRFVTSALTILLVPHLAQVASAARCDPTGADAAAIATARAQVEETCGCASAATHGDYVACSAGVLTARVHAEQLPASCKQAAQRCAARSTCGRAGAVACCKTNAAGLTKASIKKSAAACRAPEGGTACASGHASVCDACDADGCAPVCGDGTIEPGEGCEPPGSAFCDDSCQLLPGCGNGVWGGRGLRAGAELRRFVPADPRVRKRVHRPGRGVR
jgi:hypothetical protein